MRILSVGSGEDDEDVAHDGNRGKTRSALDEEAIVLWASVAPQRRREQDHATDQTNGVFDDVLHGRLG